MTILGVSALSHDAAIAVYEQGKIIYASHGERYSRLKNDKYLHDDQIQEALSYGEPEHIYFYENTAKKKFRQLIARQYKLLFKERPKRYLERRYELFAPMTQIDHHHSHAAYAYYSQSDFRDRCDVLVIDSIGEFETLSIWHGRDHELNKIWSQNYPHSVGLWYSAMTQRLGLRPQEHEYILMGMAALGDPGRFYNLIQEDFFERMPDSNNPSVKFKHNLHRGCQNWRLEYRTVQDYADIAAAVQKLYEKVLMGILDWMWQHTDAQKIAVVGGCALNCVGNTLCYRYYPEVWVPPNPGDAGSSVGAIMASIQQPMPLRDPFLGHNISGRYPINNVVDDLINTGISAVASGRAEFGPRALGHRSILADPRIINIKDRVNCIKQREEFRPFAPMILLEHVSRYFQIPTENFESPFMQFAIPCKQPEKYPGIVHVDGTSRVQTVGPSDDPDVRQLLETWYSVSGCPMLLNTSLNIRGELLINTRPDAVRWSKMNKLSVRIPDV